MNDLEKTLRRDFAPWFDELAWGVQCGVGWSTIILDCTAEIAAALGGPEAESRFRVVQIKEKYGTLRYYLRSRPARHAAAINRAIDRAEERSAVTCEVCGAPGVLRETATGILHTACDRHPMT
jgi:hypothetical protein